MSSSSPGRRLPGRCGQRAAAVKPDAEYGRGDTGEWVAVERYPDDVFEERLRGIDMVGWPYQGPFDTLEPGAAVDHRVIPWEEVSLDEGTGIVHIAPGAGQEDFALGQEHGCPCSLRSTSRAFLP